MRNFTTILLLSGMSLVGGSAFYASYVGAGLQKLSQKKAISKSDSHRSIRGGGYRYGK